MGRLAFLCPGQGCQSSTMFDMARTDPRANARVEDWLADDGLGPVLKRAMAGDGLYSNRIAQPAIVAATLAMRAALGEVKPALVAGYSIGELAAYGVAEALDPTEVIHLACARAQMMDACREQGRPQAMVALSGLPEGSTRPLLERFDFVAAIITGEDSVVAGGPEEQREALIEAASDAGARAQGLRVEIASHTPYMARAVAPFAALLQQQRWSLQSAPVLSGITGEQVECADTAIDHLSRQLAAPIRWKECMDACVEFGVTVALELGPGSALSRMLQTRHPQIACRSVTEFRSLDGVRAWLARQDA